jgi:hypothetical protein
MSEWSSRYVFPNVAPASPACARTQTLVRVRCGPALLPGPLTPRREGFRALRGFAREVASRLNEARASKRGGLYFQHK